MTLKTIAKISLVTFAALTASSSIASEINDSTEVFDRGVLYLTPLFDYPIAPEEIESFTDKCDWLAENFWTPFDFKSKEAVDQAKLNHAFSVYANTCQYASKEKVSAAVDKLMKSIQKNPTLLVQFAKAAEESIYGPRAEVWIDELYVRILKNALASKKFPKSRRPHYEYQMKLLEGSMTGATPPAFDFKRPNGDSARYFPMSTPTIIIFGDPDCDDCRRSRLRMETNVAFTKAVADGRINVLYIIPDPDEGWEKKIEGFPKNWTIGASDSVAELYDMRVSPEIYIIDAEGKIADKHVDTLQAMDKALKISGK